ncbi:toxin VasX [Atopomonas sediminilitoris]|uniref:toxin VasX n=1 Tax=Atopomonas sediminilitoris TaxID=2919919 RepID=UPI001F4ED63C|nr:toxin VasX [Atopomonas sediminilitoris]MCJ8170468.1 hypothetical protein [Atopomonas sediminilitoris]
MTAQQPPRNPNHASANCNDAKQAVATCPLLKAKVQLLPLRYAIVERHDPGQALAMPYRLKARPLGIRLLRDGWLYVIVEQQPQPILHEYRIEQGLISQLLWNNSEVTSDTRTTSVGPAQLIFPRHAHLYVAYSEVQWTAAKCAQVLKHRQERQHFMQSARCQAAGGNLLTREQTAQWLAEIAEPAAKPDPNIPAAEQQDYLWQQATVFRKTALGQLERQLNPNYQHDHLYLLVRDDIGVMRDLAEHQDAVVEWISRWSNDAEIEKKYVIGTYIERLYHLDEAKLLQAATQDPRFSQLQKDTNAAQRQSIVDYLNEKHRPSSQVGRGGAAQKAASTRAARLRMQQSLGGPLYERYADLIDSLDDHAKDTLHGAKFGQRGISDLVHRREMEVFLAEQRKHLQRWNERLDLISEDRTALLSAKRFHQAAWYFDPRSSTQIEAALATEYACLKDICRTDQATDALASLLNQHPELSLPGFYTLSRTNQADAQTKIAGLIKGLRDSAMANNDRSGTQQLSAQFNSLIERQLPHVFHLSADAITFNQLRNTAYEPAKQLSLAAALDNALNAVRTGAPFDPSKVLRALPKAAWLDVLRAFKQGGITAEFASASQIQAFTRDSQKLLELRRELTAYKHQIRQTLALERRGRAPKGTHRDLIAARKSLQQSLQPLESKVAAALSPIGDGPSKAGFTIKGLNTAQVAEFQRMADDYRHKRSFKGLSNAVFSSAGADVFASAVAVYQIRNFVVVATEFADKTDRTTADAASFFNALFSMSASVFAAAQGIAVTSLNVAFNNYASAAGKLRIAARIGRLTASFGIPTYLFSSAASALSLKGSIEKLSEGLRRGDAGMLTGATMSSLGDAGQVGLNGWAFYRSGGIVIDVLKTPQQARAAAWAAAGGRLVSIAARVNLVGLALTALQLGGEWLYNRNNLSKIDQWLQQGPWGESNAGRPLSEEHQRLAAITNAPSAALQAHGSGQLTLQLPGVLTAELDDSNIHIAAYWLTDMQRNHWQPWTEPLLYQLKPLSQAHEPLRLSLELFPNEANAQHGLGIEVRYPALPGSTTMQLKRFETLTLNAHEARPLAEVALLRVRNPDAPILPLTRDALIDEPSKS